MIAGYQAIKSITEEARRLADTLKDPDRRRMLTLCDDIDRLANQLADMQRRGLVCLCYFMGNV